MVPWLVLAAREELWGENRVLITYAEVLIRTEQTITNRSDKTNNFHRLLISAGEWLFN